MCEDDLLSNGEEWDYKVVTWGRMGMVRRWSFDLNIVHGRAWGMGLGV